MEKIWKSYNFIILFAVFCFISASVLSYQSSKSLDSYQVVKIQEGENLWMIAQEYADLYDMALIDFIEWVEVHNNTYSTNVFVGQELVIPVKIENNSFVYNEIVQLASN